MTDSTHTNPEQNNPPKDIREQLKDAINYLERILPGQAPIRDFVHFNILEGYQNLPFPQAIKASKEATGRAGYLPESRFREFFKNGRITLDDLDISLDANESLQCATAISDQLCQRDIYRVALLHTLKPITASQLNWLNDENGMNRLQPDVDSATREKILASAKTHGHATEGEAVRALWQSCLNKLDLQHYLFHPEELLEYDPEKTEDILTELDPDKAGSTPGEISQQQHFKQHLHQQVHKESRNRLGQLLRQVGHSTTLRGLLKTLTGTDILDNIRPGLQRHIASYLDQGMSSWHSSAREKGFYAAWRQSAHEDLAWMFDQMPDWHDNIRDLPDDPIDTIMLELRNMGVAESHWITYIERLVLELPGWSGMFLWRQRRPGYEGNHYPVEILDYIAVRLVLERLYAQRLCHQQWQLEANLDIIRWYFRRRRSEFFVRYNLFNEHLPEYLVTLTQRQLENAQINHSDYQPWKQLADMIINWQQSPLSGLKSGYSVFRHGWQLFCMAQYLGLCAEDIDALSSQQVEQIFNCLNNFDEDQRGFIWLQAYERNYREQLFNALINNRGRGRWKQRQQRPEAQLVFCMDDREEGIRRHLEEHNPQIETLGAAGFFGVAINWKGLDDEKTSALCPVIVTPAHELHEVANADAMA
ncbi:MAG TPA: putative inorganic carbon transporter subunit DabA, partial [Gammaproteobacteria bacterium]